MTIRLPALVLLLALTLLPLFGTAARAADGKRFTCEELREIGKDITVASGFLKGESIEGAAEESEIDRALRGMVEELDGLAKAESDPELTAAVKELDKAWQDMDGDAYEVALERGKGAYERIFGQRCK